MSVVFTKSANGEATCICNNVRLHSAYNPSQEALRFVQGLQCDFSPAYILVTGAGLSYSAVYLRKTFPKAILIALHYSTEFKITEKLWDKSFYYSENNSMPLAEQLFSYMGEEGIVSCFFISWKPSEKAFPEESSRAWMEIKSAVIKSRNVLATRSFFARRWVKNTIRFCLYANKTCYFQKGSSPIVVCASGPSLETSIPHLKKNRDSFFLIAVSSALKPLVTRGIIPDVCVSTDGGFWAKKHISFALKEHPEIPLALSPESAVFTPLLNDTMVIPLSYGDGISEQFMKEFGYTGTIAYRNGTVSGTAAQLGLSLTDGNVYFCGLDLAPGQGFVHTQPNELECTDNPKDFRLRPTATRITPSNFPSASLNIYRNWFSSSTFNKRLFRLSDNFEFSNTLGEIKDVNWNFFEQNETSEQKMKPMRFFTSKQISKDNRIELIDKIVKNNTTNPDWIKEAVPADYIVYMRSVGMQSETENFKKMQTDMTKFIKDIVIAYKGKV